LADKFDIEKAVRETGSIDENTINQLKSGGAEKMISRLSDEDKQKLVNTLSDKEAMEKLLASPQAKKLMELFKRGKN